MKALCLNCCPGDLAPALAAALRRRRYPAALLEPGPDGGVRLRFDPSRDGILTFSAPKTVEELRPYLQEDFLLSTLPLPGVPDLSPRQAAGPLTALALAPGEPVEALADRVVERTPELLPFPSGSPCCHACAAGSCPALLEAILAGRASPADCGLDRQDVVVEVNGQPLSMVGFVQRILRKTNLGILELLDGYAPNSQVVIRIRPSLPASPEPPA